MKQFSPAQPRFGGFSHDFFRVGIIASGETADGVQFKPCSTPLQIGKSVAQGIAEEIRP